MDVSTVRAEIKAWERSFRSENGRDPTVQEIKAQPHIADKYKLYKKLSKQTSLPQKQQPVQTQPPSISSNPFSPVKKNKLSSGNPFATPTKSRTRPPPRDPSPDPFPLIQHNAPSASISPKHVEQDKVYDPILRARKRLRGEHVSPSPVKEKKIRVSSSSQPLAAPDFASARLSRSTKVLDTSDVSAGSDSDGDGRAASRGASSEANGDPRNDEDEEVILANSPVKPATAKGGRAFKALFEEAPLPRPQFASIPSRTRTGLGMKTKSQTTLPFTSAPAGKPTRRAVFLSDEEDEDTKEGVRKIGALSINAVAPPAHARLPKSGPSIFPRLPTKSDLHTSIPSPSTMSPFPSQTLPPHAPGVSSSKKRTRNDDMDVDPLPGGPSSSKPSTSLGEARSLNKLPLLPPSPPPPSAKSYRPKPGGKPGTGPSAKAKGKRLSIVGLARKKARLLGDNPIEEGEGNGEDNDSEESEEVEEDVRVVEKPWRWNRLYSKSVGDGREEVEVEGDEGESEFDPERVFPHSRGAHAYTIPNPQEPPDRGTSHTPMEEQSTALPDTLRQIIDLRNTGTHRHAGDTLEKEEKLAKTLLTGRRMYAGEVWGAGEIDGDEGDEGIVIPGEETGRGVGAGETDDEWEGEGVPWEVGEL